MGLPFHFQWNARLVLVCFTALAASLPMAWVSLSKLLLFAATLVLLLSSRAASAVSQHSLPALTSKAVLVVLAAFAASLAWTEVDLSFALGMLVKHAKLLQIVLLVYLIRSVREARVALQVFVWGQLFILASSWLLAAGFTLPWVNNDQNFLGTRYVVFSESYLDQSIMLAALAAIVWHVHQEWKWPRALAGLLAMAALLNVLLLLPGRTGYVASFTVALMALLWHLSWRMRWTMLVLGPVAVAVTILAGGASRVSERITAVVQESQSYSQTGDTTTSSGWRLHAWRRSLEAISFQPETGYGVGSWATAVKRLDGENATANFGTGNSSNPHQEFLLWGVELGVGGIVLLIALLLAMLLDAIVFPSGIRRATQSVIAVAAVACMFNSSLYDALIGDYLCTAIGLLMALGIRRHAQETTMAGISRPIARSSEGDANAHHDNASTATP